MWSSRHHEDSSATPAQVWELVAAVHAGERTVDGHEAYRADGPLGAGTVVRAVQDSFVGPEMTVVEFEPGVRYAHEFTLRRYTVQLGYTVESHEEGGSRLVRTIGITGPFADLATAGLGRELAAVYAPQVKSLVDALGA